MKQFQVPVFYRSSLISAIKSKRKAADKLKKDFSPTLLDLGSLKIYLARHFGFCYGVENAIEIAYRCVDENPGKRIFLLSEMIHNPQVNENLQSHGIRFLQDSFGKTLIPFEALTADDVVIIPAFGTTVAIEEKLSSMGISPHRYNTTCPFVEKVWNRGEQLAAKGYSLIIHGKPKHEETRATFSRAAQHAPSVIVNDMAEAVVLGEFITGQQPATLFKEVFAGKYSQGFEVEKHLRYMGVINQTTQLATDTQAIADYLKKLVESHFGETDAEGKKRFADTRDTLCYATNDNQTAVREMLQTQADLAIVVGGYNSSNTSHLVELCEYYLPTYYIKGPESIDADSIVHFDWRNKQELTTASWLPTGQPLSILLTSGASCPDALVEEVMEKLIGLVPQAAALSSVEAQFS
ncbi:MAG: 4-hydroxy-3-methylbut-2-enyl diphosphate reductase [Chitinophagaceae bacterium]|jgi:4-hydroxy-3-methylbut-2-enyl diphosphate reductase|nr:4-hydroxy-3-methylbut-2-enyl diphosphate reductase [Chitinophagaceae bacterium]